MNYSSTRGQEKNVSFENVLLNGLAKDGGLYVPDSIPKFDKNFIQNLKGVEYYKLVHEITYVFVKDEISYSDYLEICEKSYRNFSDKRIISLTKLNENESILNLFYGPTLAFKDFALQLLGNIYDYVLKKKKKKLSIIGATSGDTGSAAIEGCSKSEFVKMFILFPHKKVSEIQRKQMTTLKKKNVYNLAVNGDFDDCQKIVKSLFKRNNINKKINYAAINSINWVRIMGQIVYYFWSFLNFSNNLNPLNFSVPTGNFGNVYAGFIAIKMGLPISRLIVSSNTNDVLTRFFESGVMQIKPTLKTLSPSMDIQVSSNFERLLYDFNDDNLKGVRKFFLNLDKFGKFEVSNKILNDMLLIFRGGKASDEETKLIINKIFKNNKIIIDPHTAVGIHVGRKILDKKEKVIYFSTAHYGKFIDIIQNSIGNEIKLPKKLEKIKNLPENYKIVENNIDYIEKFIIENSH